MDICAWASTALYRLVGGWMAARGICLERVSGLLREADAVPACARRGWVSGQQRKGLALRERGG